jgi:Transposase DDE domain
MEHVIDRGIQVLIPPDASRRKSPRPGWDGGYYAFLRRVLARDRGGELYRQRQPMIEPVFDRTKYNRAMDRFHPTAEPPVRTEWRLITATHNLLKLHRYALEPPEWAIRSPSLARNGDQEPR